MKLDKNILISFGLLIIMAALYRAMPGRIWGFAPHIAMAIFGGSVIKDRKLAFLLPVLSLFLSDVIYHVLYLNGITPIAGFYSGMIENYILFALLTIIGFAIKETNVAQIFAGAVAGPVLYFLASNFMVWIGGGGLGRPKTLTGLMQCYADGLPFFQTSLYGTFFFSTLLFGGLYLTKRFLVKSPIRTA
jgi:hypothetical protein